jgi:3-phenylpropionate/cinnamic acid dioxygenase small subunit
MDLEELASRVRTLEDERSILRVLHDYGRSIDYGDAVAWLDLFTSDASFELSYRPELKPTRYGDPQGADHQFVYAGQAMLRTFIQAHTHAPDRYHKHVVTGARIDIAGDIAHCESYFMRVDERDKHPVIVAAGRYVDTLVRSPDTCWRLTHRRAEIEASLSAR